MKLKEFEYAQNMFTLTNTIFITLHADDVGSKAGMDIRFFRQMTIKNKIARVLRKHKFCSSLTLRAQKLFLFYFIVLNLRAIKVKNTNVRNLLPVLKSRLFYFFTKVLGIFLVYLINIFDTALRLRFAMSVCWPMRND